MKFLLPILLLSSPLFGSWNYYRTITVNASQITGTLSSYPMLVNGTYTYLKTVGNGGLVQNSSGYDIAFFSDSALTMALPCETEFYSASTGGIVYFVNVASIANGTVIYMAYGNSAISTPQCTGTSVWDANASLVAHFPNGSSLTTADSTGNNTISNAGTATATNTNCAADGCASFNGSSNYMTVANTASIQLGTALTIELWLYVPAQCGSNTTCNVWIDKVDRGGTGKGYFLGYNESAGSANWIEFFLQGTSTSCDYYAGTFSTSNLIYIAATYDGTTLKVFRNGSQLSNVAGCSGTSTVGSTNTTHALYIGALDNGGGLYSNGPMDEVRLSNTNRSAAWISANFNNISAPASFYTVGSQVVLSSFAANPSVFGIAVQ